MYLPYFNKYRNTVSKSVSCSFFTINYCTGQHELDTKSRKSWTPKERCPTNAILDRALKNNVKSVPTAKNSSAIDE